MKQSQLSFNTSKRGAAATAAKAKAHTPVTVTPASKPITVHDSDDSHSEDESRPLNSKSIQKEEEKVEKSIVRKRSQKLSEGTKTTKIQAEPPKIDVTGLPDLNVKDPRWKKLYDDAKKQMGGQKPIHGKDEDRVTEILRVFDLNDEYGPCAGIPRLERWERAKAAGLDPPQEIYEILQTKQGKSETKYSQTVFYGEILE